MPFPLELKFMPEYDKNFGYKTFCTDVSLINQAIDTKNTCNEIAPRFGEFLEQVTLRWFQTLFDRLSVQPENVNFFGRHLSILMKMDVI